MVRQLERGDAKNLSTCAQHFKKAREGPGQLGRRAVPAFLPSAIPLCALFALDGRMRAALSCHEVAQS